MFIITFVKILVVNFSAGIYDTNEQEFLTSSQFVG
jgi:hypothetical protein